MLDAGLSPEAIYLGCLVQAYNCCVESNLLLGLRRLLSIPISLAQSNYFGVQFYIASPVAQAELSQILPRPPEKRHLK